MGITVELFQDPPHNQSNYETGVDQVMSYYTSPVYRKKPPVDISDRLLLDGLGVINRAAERDLLSFRTGDLTLSLRNDDDYFTKLFALFGATDKWQLRICRDHKMLFHGVIMGLGSTVFNHNDKTAELTVYGNSKVLDDSPADIVNRIMQGSGYHVQTATAGTATLVLQASTAYDFLPGDVLHLTDHVNSEDVIVKTIVNNTTITLAANLSNTYATGTVVEPQDEFHRFVGIEFLVKALFSAARIPMAEYRVLDSQFKRLAPVPISPVGLDLTKDIRTFPAEIDGVAYLTQMSGATYYQRDPEDQWTQYDANDRPWVDWSRYYTEHEDPPGIILRSPVTGADPEGREIHRAGFDYKSATKTMYYMDGDTTYPTSGLKKTTTVDGVTWSAPVLVSAAPATNGNTADPLSVEYDPVLDGCYCVWGTVGPGVAAYFYDIGLGTWTTMHQGDDTGNYNYWGPIWVPSKGYCLVLRTDDTDGIGPEFEICAFQGTSRLWKRSFPSMYIGPGAAYDRVYHPLVTLREVNGVFYCLIISDGAVQLLTTDDEFLSYSMKPVFPNTSHRYLFGSRINGQYRIWSYDGSDPDGHLTAAPFYAGVIKHADYEDMSVSEALSDLATLANAMYWVDDDLQGHFVARDLYEPGTESDITDLVMERSDTLLWDQAVQFISVDNPGGDAETSGDTSFAASSLDLSSPHIENAAFAKALADSYYDFFSKDRKELRVVLDNQDCEIYTPLRRVLLDGIRYLIYEVDDNIVDQIVTLTLLEDK